MLSYVVSTGILTTWPVLLAGALSVTQIGLNVSRLPQVLACCRTAAGRAVSGAGVGEPIGGGAVDQRLADGHRTPSAYRRGTTLT
jgi:hypothetical protein